MKQLVFTGIKGKLSFEPLKKLQRVVAILASLQHCERAPRTQLEVIHPSPFIICTV